MIRSVQEACMRMNELKKELLDIYRYRHSLQGFCTFLLRARREK